MKRIVFTLIITIALFSLAACSSTASANPANPIDRGISPVLPTTIQDPILLKGWKMLYDQQKAIRMPDGSIMTGRELAQFIIDQAIPVLWTPTVDGHQTSYSTIVCTTDVCTYTDGQPGAEPLYITASIKALGNDRMQQLVERLAHEIYHRMQPFGRVHITLFEEYSAYYLSMQISQSTWAAFKGYDVLNPSCLTRWFKDQNLMYAYQQLGLYPQSVLPAVNRTSQACHLAGDTTDQAVTSTETSTQTIPQGNLTCHVNMEGVAICENTK